MSAINFCLDRLYRDSKKRTTDLVCDGCDYEELIGALLLARDAIAQDAIAHRNAEC